MPLYRRDDTSRCQKHSNSFFIDTGVCGVVFPLWRWYYPKIRVFHGNCFLQFIRFKWIMFKFFRYKFTFHGKKHGFCPCHYWKKSCFTYQTSTTLGHFRWKRRFSTWGGSWTTRVLRTRCQVPELGYLSWKSVITYSYLSQSSRSAGSYGRKTALEGKLFINTFVTLSLLQSSITWSVVGK